MLPEAVIIKKSKNDKIPIMNQKEEEGGSVYTSILVQGPSETKISICEKWLTVDKGIISRDQPKQPET